MPKVFVYLVFSRLAIPWFGGTCCEFCLCFFWLCCVCGVEPLFWFRSFVWSKAPWACCTCLCCQSYSRKCFWLRTFVRSNSPLGMLHLFVQFFFCQRRFCFNPLLGPKPLGFFGICVLTPRVFWLQIIVRSKSPLGVLHLFVQFFFAKGVFVSILC